MEPDLVEAQSAQCRFVAELLRVRSADLSGVMARQLIAGHPDVERRYHPLAADRWRECFVRRLGDLAAAIDAKRPEVFAVQMGWERDGFAARNAPVADLDTALGVMSRCLTSELDPQDVPLVHTYIDAGRRVVASPAVSLPSKLDVHTSHGRLAATFLVAVLEGDRDRAAGELHRAVAAGLSVEDVYLRVLVPALVEIGRMWHMDEINVAEEHFATTTVQAVMSQLQRVAPRAPWNGKTLLASCVDGNSHEVGLRIVADFFEFAGWKVVYIGSSAPADDIAQSAQQFDVDLVAISASLPVQVPAVEETIRRVREECPGARPAIIVGGRAFGASPEDWRRIGADGCAPGPREAVQLGESLCNRAPLAT